MYEEIRPLQLKQLEILKELKRVCDKNGLTYFLTFGTLLGAVRHKGFIPWDNDIDVCMNYADYVKLDEACKRDLGEDYFLQTESSDPECHLTYKKLRLNSSTFITQDDAEKDMHHGIHIDIYPMFHVADNPAKRRFQICCAIVYLLMVVGEPPKNHGQVMKLGGALALKLVGAGGRAKLKRFCLREMTRYNNIDTRFRAMFFGNARCGKTLYPADSFKKTDSLLFEDAEFSVPLDYRKCLTLQYGDYMKLPPINEQTVKLDRLVKFDTNTSYLHYKGVYYCVDK